MVQTVYIIYTKIMMVYHSSYLNVVRFVDQLTHITTGISLSLLKRFYLRN